MSAIAKPRAVLHTIPNPCLVETDGVPLESPWHFAAISLLIEIIIHLFKDRDDFFVGGNNFIYYSEAQARNKDYRGPDFYYVEGVERRKERRYWAVWEEEGRFPDFIVELASPTTETEDLTTKKDIYEKTFRTHEYACYQPETRRLTGWRLDPRGRYRKIAPDQRGRLWIETLKLSLGLWSGEFQGIAGTWPRFFDARGKLVPTRAEAAEAELAILKARLAKSKGQRKR